MGEEFEDRDLSESVFWGVRLTKSLFRDADFSGSEFFHTKWSEVSIDGEIDQLMVNGVDVTAFVNEHDRWYPLRNELSPATAEGIRSSWATLDTEWSALLDRAAALGDAALSESVDGQWSLRDTLRHLVFAMDKWFTWPILGERTFSAIGLPNTGSQSFDWPGIDRDADPDVATVLAERQTVRNRFAAHIASLDVAALPAEVEVLENGTVPAIVCFHVVLEEEFEHLRYATRDLAVIDARLQGST